MIDNEIVSKIINENGRKKDVETEHQRVCNYMYLKRGY